MFLMAACYQKKLLSVFVRERKKIEIAVHFSFNRNTQAPVQE